MTWYEWVFDGIGGPVILGTFKSVWRRIFSKSHAVSPPVSANLNSVSDSNVAIGTNVSQNISVHHPGKDSRPKIVFRATRLPSSKWFTLEGTPPGVFTLTHIGGDAARFITIEPIQSALGKKLWVVFDQIDLLDSSTREVHPSFALLIGEQKRSANEVGNLIYVFFKKDAGEKETVDYPVSVKFRWDKELIEERVTLTWNSSTGTLTTSPTDCMAPRIV